MPSRGKESYSIQSVDNALDLLETLCEEGDEVRISRLSEKLGMNKTSVFRLLATFENRGYVECDKGSGKYRLGLSAYEIGQKFLSRMELLRKARPVMERLVRQCNESVYLTVPSGDDVLFFDTVDTAQQVKIVSLVGKRYPLHSTSAGKVILANSTSFSESCGDKAQCREEFHAIRERGTYADRDTLGESVASIAVPLFNASEKVPGALCFVGPDFRMPEERIETEFLPRLKEAGETISSKLGHLGSHLEKSFF